jgi:hypothetical protein
MRTCFGCLQNEFPRLGKQIPKRAALTKVKAVSNTNRVPHVLAGGNLTQGSAEMADPFLFAVPLGPRWATST